MKSPKRPKVVEHMGAERGRKRVYGTEWPVYDSIEQMAAASGIPADLLRKSKKEGCLFVRHGRCHSGEWVRWFFNREMGGDVVHDWPTRDKAATALIKETKLEILRRSVVKFELVDKFLRFLIGRVFFEEIDRIRADFPVMLKGRGEVEIAKLVGVRMDKLAENCKAAIKGWEAEQKTTTERTKNEKTKKRSRKIGGTQDAKDRQAESDP